MVFDAAHYATTLASTYGYVLFFPLVMLEGPIITMFAAFLASTGLLDVYLIFVLAVIADVLADCLYYALGYWGRTPLGERWLKIVGISAKHAQKLESRFEKHGSKLLFVGKVSHGVGGVFLVAAGFAKMPFRSFLWFDFLATLPKTLLLVLLGYFFGHSLARLDSIFGIVAAVLLGIGIIAVLYFIISTAREEDTT